MAPPSPRRPGFSRRAQYSLFAGYVIAIAGAFVGLLLVITAHFDPQGHAAIQGVLTDIFSPLSRGGRTIVQSAKIGGSDVSAYLDAASKNKALTEEVARLRAESIEHQENSLELARLKRLLKLQEPPGQVVFNARLVGSTGSSSRRYAILAAGRAAGAEPGQVVVGPDGLVGRIVQSGRYASRVLMIIDAGNVVPVKRVKDGIPALATGLGDGRLDIHPLAAGSNPFQPGDIFVTSGTGGIYRPGIPVAVAVRKTRDRISGVPAASPARLDFAAIERPFTEALPPLPDALPREEQ